MSDHLIFMMGEFEAQFPSDRQYCSNHMWAVEVDEQIRFGFTAYAVRLLQDVYFLDWLVDAPVAIQHQQEIGSIESKKAESSLYAPLDGQLVTFNDELMDDPSAINVDKYGNGWLFEVSPGPNASEHLMTAESYVESLVDVWKKTERTIKGQVNQAD